MKIEVYSIVCVNFENIAKSGRQEKSEVNNFIHVFSTTHDSMPNSLQVPFFSNFFCNMCLELLAIQSVDENGKAMTLIVMLRGTFKIQQYVKGPASA